VKALILAGGRGVRLRPITHTSAKQLVPIANKPILFYAIESVVAAGINEIGMIVGDTESEVRSTVGDGSLWGARITYIRQSAPLGLAHAVKEAESYLRGSPFVMYLGDNLVPAGIGSFVQEFERSKPDALVLLARVRAPERFGVAELRDGRLVRLEEKPKTPRSDLALVGMYLFADRIFEAVNAIEPSARGELEITDAIQWLIDHDGRVEPHIIDSWWRDTGRLEDLLEANRKVLETLQPSNEGTIVGQSRIVGNVALGKGVEIVDSVVRGPAIIWARTRIINSYVGPNTSIGSDVEIQGSEIEHSVVLDGSQICDAGVKIEDSLIGKEVIIRRTKELPKALRFMLGDHSEVELT
jgi:glucose-1-phosphate thymidylyltransferase